MVREVRAQGVSERDRKRVKTQADAAGLLGIAPQRLQEMRRLPSPWWRDELCNADGWDVVGIAIAQVMFHEDRSRDDEGLAKRARDAELKKSEEEAAIKALDRMKRERVESEAEKQLVRVTVVQSLLCEALGELRRLIDDVPYVMSQQVPDELKPFVWVDEAGVTEISKLSPLQRVLLKVTEGYQRWLERIPEDVFELQLEEPAE